MLVRLVDFEVFFKSIDVNDSEKKTHDWPAPAPQPFRRQAVPSVRHAGPMRVFWGIQMRNRNGALSRI